MQSTDESKVLRVKRFIFFNIRLVAYALWILAFISLPFIALSLLPSLADILKSWNIDLEKGPLQGSLAMSLFAAVIAALLGRAWIPQFQRWISQRTLPVNTSITERHLEQYELYNDAISVRIKNLLPEDLRLPWIERSTGSKFLIPIRAEELASTETKRAPAGRIKDLSHFLDLEFFFNVKGRFHPITIQGEPGSGKSTLIFELYRQQANRLHFRKQGWIPILVFAHELSWEMLSEQSSLRTLLVAYFNKCFDEYQHAGYGSISQLLRDHYDEYQFIIIVDGLDEITNRPLYEKMTKRLNQLLEKEWFEISADSNANRYIVSCRTDDNQHTITSRLVSLLPLDYETVMAHLQRLVSAYRKVSSPKEQETRNIIRGLTTSKANRLLQNYIRNPYLLSLIREYYQEQDNPPARTLGEVFAQVLHRELSKPRADFEGELKRGGRAQLLGYLSSLLAPYCYVRTIDTLLEGKSDEADFSRYIKKDEALANVLFGSDGHIGYIQGVYQDNSLVRENRIRELTKIWGDEKTTEFRDFLTRVKTSTKSLNEFIDEAVRYLHRDVLELLKISNLAEVDETTGVVKRFRHRRMQDYFMALFVDRIGVIGEGAAVFPLGNAWMREPIRILAAISAKPEQLISAFNDAYRSLQEARPSPDSQHLSKLTDLMLNASEAIAYLPSPQQRDQDQPLYRLVVTLGLEAQHLYFLASQKTQKSEGERRGWLDLLEKCLETLRNIYASEYLRNDKSLFNSYYPVDDKARKNSWKVLHEQIQWEPDSYQHMAYSYLYPIRRLQTSFPVSGGSLFFYVADAVLCFPAAYDRLIKETHPKRRTRLLIWIGSAAEMICSLVLIGLILILAWGQVDDSQSIEFKVFKIGIAVGVGFICAWCAQIFGLMRWSEFHHAPTWVVLKLGKKTFLAAKIILPILVRLPFKIILGFVHNFFPFIRFIWRDLLPFIGEIIRDGLTGLVLLARMIVRNPKRLLLLAMIITILATLWIYVVPAAIYAVGAWEYSSSVARFNERVGAIDHSYLTHKDEIEKLGTPSISEADYEKQKNLMSKLDQQDKDIVELMSQGQSLANSGNKYAGQRREVINQIEKLRLRKADVNKLQGFLVDKGKIFQWELRFQTFKDNLSRADAEISKLSSVGQDEPSIAEVQSQIDQINDSLTKISDLQKEGESLHRYDQRSSEITSLNRRIAEKKSKLERVIQRQGDIPSSPTTDIRTVLTERTAQLLDRTTLTELGPKLSILNEVLESEERRLTAIELRLTDTSDWWPPAFYENYQVARDLKYIGQIQSLYSSTPLMQRQLADYAAEISAHLGNMKEANQPKNETKRLEERMSEIHGYQKQVEQYIALQPKLKVGEIHSTLLTRQQENEKQLSRQRDRLLYLLMFSPVLLIGLLIARHYGDKSGERQLKRIISDYRRLLDFVRKNGYSLNVNVHAIAYLNKAAPPSYQSLRQISDAAEERLRRPGEVNERIGYLLRDVAKGIDNILNRQSL